MPAYRGKNLVVKFAGASISGDGRSIQWEESADILDDTTVGDDAKTKQAGLLDGNGSFEGLDKTGAWAADWTGIKPGTTDTLEVYPEGDTIGLRMASFTAVIKTRSIEVPYDDLSKVSMSFEISGPVTEGVAP